MWDYINRWRGLVGKADLLEATPTRLNRRVRPCGHSDTKGGNMTVNRSFVAAVALIAAIAMSAVGANAAPATRRRQARSSSPSKESGRGGGVTRAAQLPTGDVRGRGAVLQLGDVRRAPSRASAPRARCTGSPATTAAAACLSRRRPACTTPSARRSPWDPGGSSRGPEATWASGARDRCAARF